MNWTPSHVVVTVTKARNLLDKGKGGNDAYCMIGMGKEKFLTSVKAKTLAPTWDEQAEFALGEREDLKLTVYHKSSIIDEFIGRVVINVSELASFDTNHSHVGWFKLGGKPDKSDHKKAEKDRGEIEVRIDFLVKPKAGSMMDLSLKSKEKSLSLRNLKEKSSTLKQSFGDKLKILQKGRKSKYAGENQLAEQAKRMGGSKIDFLDGDDVTSITSSYSSINGSNLQRFNDSKQINSMSRFNPTRSSFVSGSSSRLENDSSSNYGNDNTRNEEDFEDENDSADFDRDSANGSSFQRRNSSKFGRSTNASIKRQLSRRSSTLSTPIIENLNIINEHSKIETNEDDSSNKDSIHIAPLPPFNNSTSTPALAQRNKKAPAPKSPEKIPSKVSSPTQNNQDSFASIFAASFGSNNKSDINNSTSSHSTLTQTNTSQTTSNGSNLTSASINSSINQSILTKNEIINKPESPKKQAPQPPSVQLQPPSLPPLPPSVSAKAKKNMNYSHDEEDEDHIDWASSEDEEIVKQEIESFERNQVPKTKLLDTNLETLQIDNKSSNTTNKQSSLFSDLFSFDNKPLINQSQQLNQQFSIDIDPFSSSSSANSSFSKNKPVNKYATDPFGIGLANDTKPIDPSTIFDNFTKMNDPTETQLDFSNVKQLDDTTQFDQKNQEQNDQETPSFQISYKDPIEDEQYNEDEDIGNAFITYSNSEQVNLSDESKLDEMTLISNELAESKLKLTEILEEDEDMSERQTNVVDRVVSDSDSMDSIDERNEELNKFSIDNLKIEQQNSEDDDEDSNKDNNQVQSTLSAASPDSMDEIKLTLSRQSERRRLMPAEDLTSDLNSETDFNTLSARNKQAKLSLNQRNANKNKMQIDLKTTSDQTTVDDYDVKTPDLDIDFRFQEETNKKMDTTNDSSNGAMSNDNSNNSGRNNGLPDLINQKGNNDSTDKARKYLEGLDGVKFNEIQVPDQLKKQLEYFDRDELLQLIAYQKKYLDFKESRIKDLENYIDNLVVKIIEKEPSILMNASNVLTKSRNLI